MRGNTITNRRALRRILTAVLSLCMLLGMYGGDIATLAQDAPERDNACWASKAQAPATTFSELVAFAPAAQAERLDPAPQAVVSAMSCINQGSMDLVANIDLIDPRISAPVSYHTGDNAIAFGLAQPGQPKPPKHLL